MSLDYFHESTYPDVVCVSQIEKETPIQKFNLKVNYLWWLPTDSKSHRQATQRASWAELDVAIYLDVKKMLPKHQDYIDADFDDNKMLIMNI